MKTKKNKKKKKKDLGGNLMNIDKATNNLNKIIGCEIITALVIFI